MLKISIRIILMLLALALLNRDATAERLQVRHYFGAGYKHDSQPGTNADETQDGFGFFHRIELEDRLYFHLGLYKQIVNKSQIDYGAVRTEFEVGYYLWSFGN